MKTREILKKNNFSSKWVNASHNTPLYFPYDGELLEYYLLYPYSPTDNIK